MTDHNSPAGAVGGGEPAGPPASFGHPSDPYPANLPAQPQAYAQQPSAYQQPQQQQQPLSPDAARAQVAAAWVRRAPQAAVPPSQAAVPPLPPRSTRTSGDANSAKKERRERARAERKAAYERKKAAREEHKGQGKGGAASTAQPTATPAAAATSATATTSATGQATGKGGGGRSFDVPRPGGRIPAGGRRTHVALRATLLTTTCLFALGSCGVMGLVIGKSNTPRTAALSAEDADRYRLTDFPTQAAATFAEHYALQCLTYSPPTAEKRRKALASFTSSGVDAECGWSGEGTQRATSATWDGTIEKLPEYGDHGRYLGIQVRLDTGRVTTLSVPVYVKDLTDGEGLRISGDVGEMPMPSRGSVPEVNQDDDTVDDALSSQLQKNVLPGYFEAWGASDATAMTRFLTPRATGPATAGLAGELTAPKVGEVDALLPKGVDSSDSYHYKTDQQVRLRVRVDWTGPHGETVKRSYRMTVVNTEQGWFVQDIHGGVLDPDGGRADNGRVQTPSDTGDDATAPSSGTPSPDPTVAQSAKRSGSASGKHRKS
ncbi:conjugal transfer protein [Streptomyces sp. NPDC005355]|uniref:conjugal transfer protein n=1 Tax=Streptomyces sp. NPDC005355 TaxID=3157038 RepID=UPI0033BDEA5B